MSVKDTNTSAIFTSPDGSLLAALTGPAMAQLETATLPQFLPKQRWFGAKDREITAVSVVPLGELNHGEHALLAADVKVGDETQRYFLPVSPVWTDGSNGAGSSAPVFAEFKTSTQAGWIVDSALEPGLAKSLLAAMSTDRRLETPDGAVVFIGSDTLRAIGTPGEPRPLNAEQSNVSIAFANTIILKLYRRLRAGEQPDVEVVRFLTSVGQFRNTPALLGEVQHRPASGEPTTLAAAFAFVPNQGDAWAAVTNALTQTLLDGSTTDAWIGAVLGQRTAEMHQSLAVETSDEDFRTEALQTADIAGWVSEAKQETKDLLDQLERNVAGLLAPAGAIAAEILAQRDALIGRIEAAATMAPTGGRSRIHGDYHLGQVLVTTDRDVMIIDFEGEPKRSLAERRAKSSPLRDVAGMLRSFHYAAWTALSRYGAAKGDVPADVRARAEHWRQGVTNDFLAAYETHIDGAASYPSDPIFAGALTDLFVLQKAIYEVGYELANRPEWVEIPLSGIRDLLNKG